MQEVLEKKVIFLHFFEKQQPKAAVDRPDGTGGNTKKVCIGIRKKTARQPFTDAGPVTGYCFSPPLLSRGCVSGTGAAGVSTLTAGFGSGFSRYFFPQNQ